MRVLLSTYGLTGDVEPLVALAVRLRELGAEVRVCVPPDDDFALKTALAPDTRTRSAAVATTIHAGKPLLDLATDEYPSVSA